MHVYFIFRKADTQVYDFDSDTCRQLTAEEEDYPCDAFNTTDFIARLIREEAPGQTCVLLPAV